MKLLMILAIVLSACSSKEYLYDKYHKELEEYTPIAKWKTDSMQVINKFIDRLPDKIKGLPEIREVYSNNLDSCLKISDTKIKMIQKITTTLDQ